MAQKKKIVENLVTRQKGIVRINKKLFLVT
jgi:hypothetical protein